jgi:hypothetical protein
MRDLRPSPDTLGHWHNKDHGDVHCASVGGNRFPNVKMFSYKLHTPIRLAASRNGHGLFT